MGESFCVREKAGWICMRGKESGILKGGKIYIYLKKMLNVGRRKLLKILILTRLGNYNTNSDRKIVRNFKIH